MADDAEKRPIFRQMNREFFWYLAHVNETGDVYCDPADIKAISQVDARIGYMLERREELRKELKEYVEEAYLKPYEGK